MNEISACKSVVPGIGFLIHSIMASFADFIASGGLGNCLGSLAAVEKFYDLARKGGAAVKVGNPPGEVAQLIKGPLQPCAAAGNAHIIPHSVANVGPILSQQGGVVIVFISGRAFPIGDGIESFVF